MCGNTKPSVMWDQLTALQPATVKEVQTVVFLHKLPRHIRNLINPRAFKEPEELIQRCNEILEDQTVEEAAAAKAATRPHSPFRDTRRSSSPFCGKGSAGNRSGSAIRPPWAPPEAAAATACVSTTPVSVPRPRSARRAALTRKTNRPAAGLYTAADAGPIPTCYTAPPPFLYRNQSQPCLPYLQRT
jgi:hypothetical protein